MVNQLSRIYTIQEGTLQISWSNIVKSYLFDIRPNMINVIAKLVFKQAIFSSKNQNIEKFHFLAHYENNSIQTVAC